MKRKCKFYALGYMHCNREAIAAYTDYQLVLMSLQSQGNLSRSSEKAFGYDVESPGFNPWLRQWNSFKNCEISFYKLGVSEL